jgi:hypothetical protein
MITFIICLKDGMGKNSYVPRWMLILDMILMLSLFLTVEIAIF